MKLQNLFQNIFCIFIFFKTFVLVYTASLKFFNTIPQKATFAQRAKNNKMKAIEQIVAIQDANMVRTMLTARKQGFKTSLLTLEKQWDPSKHKIFDEESRPKKRIKVPTGKYDPITQKPIYKDKLVEPVRIAIPAQKSIVNLTVGFLFMNAVTYKATAHGVDIKKMDDKQQKLYGGIMHCNTTIG